MVWFVWHLTQKPLKTPMSHTEPNNVNRILLKQTIYYPVNIHEEALVLKCQYSVDILKFIQRGLSSVLSFKYTEYD